MGAAAAAILAAKERETIEAFTRAGATTPAGAQSLHLMGIAEGPAVRRLRDHAVLREALPACTMSTLRCGEPCAVRGCELFVVWLLRLLPSRLRYGS
jgi:hypothetical protein